MKDKADSGAYLQPDLRKNYIYRLINEILTFALPLIAMPYISRVLGAGGVGEYSYTYSVITYFIMFGAMGTASYGAREIARNRDDKQTCSRLFWEIELMSILLCLVSLMMWLLLIMTDTAHRMVFIALTPYILGTMFDISWLFTGLERIGFMVTANAVVRIAGMMLLFLMVRSVDDLAIYCIINSMTMLTANLSMWLCLPRFLVRVSIRGFRFGNHFRATLVYFIPNIARSIYTVLDKTLIGLITGSPFQNGYYEQASKMIGVADGLSFVVFNSALYARMSYLFAMGKHEEVKNRIAENADYIMFMCFGTAFGLAGISHTLVPVFFGKGYEPVEGLIYMMLPLVPVIGISNCLGTQYYTPAGRRAQSAGYIVVGAVTNLIFNLCLIPVYEARGAVAASVAAELLITGLYLRNCDGYLTIKQIMDSSGRKIAAGICMAVIVRLLGGLKLNGVYVIIIQIFTGIITYVAILIILKDSFLRNLRERAL